MLAASGIFAVLYGAFFCYRDGSWLGTWVKTVPLAALAIYAHLSGAPVLIVLALGFSAFGDFALSRSGDRAFLAGLIGFAAAHLAYIAAFWGGYSIWAVLVLFALAVSTERWLAPHTGALKWPVRAYVIIICVMGAAASGITEPLVKLGALSFILSDLILAISLFRLPQTSALRAPFAVTLWAMYYGGQVMITLGVLAG